jgi:protein gp37
MADRSAIEWTEATWNPTTGCDQVGPGCDNCYALRMSARLKRMGVEKYQTDGNQRTSGPGFGLAIHPSTLGLPGKWRQPRTVFVNSMSDLFHDDVPLSYIRDVFDVIAETSRHTFQILTKRSKRLARLSDQLDWPENAWIGVSIENDRYTFRADHLREVGKASVRFLSCEPLLGGVPSLDLEEIDWVIAGGESGPGYRPVDVNWVRDLRDSCSEAGVPFFFKQWGGRSPKANGRELDGRLHSDTPVDIAGTG